MRPFQRPLYFNIPGHTPTSILSKCPPGYEHIIKMLCNDCGHRVILFDNNILIVCIILFFGCTVPGYPGGLLLPFIFNFFISIFFYVKSLWIQLFVIES